MKRTTKLFAPADDFSTEGGDVTTPDVVETPPEREHLTTEAISRTVAETMEQLDARKAPKVEDKGPDLDAIRSELGYYRANKEEMERLFGVETTSEQRVEAFAAMQDKMYSHMVKVMNKITNERVGAASQRFEPVMTHYQQQQLEQQRNKFYNEYPGLEQYQDVIAVIAPQIPTKDAKTGKPFSYDDQVKNLLSVVTAHLKRMGHEIDPKLKPANHKTESVQSEVPKSQSLRGSGRSTLDSQPRPPTVSKDAAIWT